MQSRLTECSVMAMLNITLNPRYMKTGCHASKQWSQGLDNSASHMFRILGMNWNTEGFECCSGFKAVERNCRKP